MKQQEQIQAKGKHHAQTLFDSLRAHEPEYSALGEVSVRYVAGHACWARNISVTYGGKTPLEIDYARRPPDVLNIENMLPHQLAVEPNARQSLNELIQR